MKKRLLPALMAFCMVLTMVPSVVFAANSTALTNQNAAYIPGAGLDGESVYYTSLDTALGSAREGDTVILDRDLTDVAVTVTTDHITLDLNGHTISGQKHSTANTGSDSNPQPSADTPAAITIGSGATGMQGEIESFTLKNGTVSVGTGLRLYEELKNLTVENVIFRDNAASNALQNVGGAAVHWEAATNSTVQGTSATFLNCQFLNNVSSYPNSGAPQGGAVALNSIETVQFTDCTFTGNASRGISSTGTANGVGGAVYLGYCGNSVFDGCTFRENAADSASGGGGVHTMWCGDLKFTDCTFIDNHAEGGAGGALALTYHQKNAKTTIENCTFTGNTASNGGGAIWITEADAELLQNTITQNSAAAGGALMLQGNANVTVSGDLTDNRTVSSYGGAVWLYGQATLTMNGNLTDNKSASHGGAIYGQWGYYYDTGAQKVGIPSVTVNGDMTGNAAGSNGGAFYGNIANLTVTGTVTGNRAGGYGGGIYNANGSYTSYPSIVDLTGASIYNNAAETAGDDLYNHSGEMIIRKVDDGLILSDCGQVIDGWYVDSADARWSHENDILFDGFSQGQDTATVGGNTALKAAHASYELTYHPNKGSGDLTTYTAYQDTTLKDIRDLGFSRPGYVFAGWSADPSAASDDTDKLYQPNETYAVTHDTTLYAIWARNSTGGGSSSGGGGSGSTTPSKPELNKEEHIAYISGYPDGTVQPEGYITREEVATIFFRLLTDASRADYITEYNPFPDVTADRWSYYSITTLNNGGIMTGRTGGTFDPGAYITRAEFAVVAAQFSNAQYSGGDKFSDLSGHWARDYINRAANEGWIAGYPDGTFGPDQYITRAEVMALVNEVLDRAPDAEYMLDEMKTWPDNRQGAWYYEDVQEATNCHSYTWRDDAHMSEQWEAITAMRSYDDMVRDAFHGVR